MNAEEYTPSLEEVQNAIKAFTVMPPRQRSVSLEEFNRFVEAVRVEEREKAVQIATALGVDGHSAGGAVARAIAKKILEAS